jgi:hypothetical protein
LFSKAKCREKQGFVKILSTDHLAVMMMLQVLPVSAQDEMLSLTSQQKNVSEIAISNYQTAQLSPNLSDEEKIKVAIDAYFTTRYEGQKILEQQDFSPLLDDDTLSWVKKENDKREIELYVASLFDLGYESYSFTLDYTSVEVKNQKATVQLFESHEVVFKAISPEISKMANLEHTITLHYKKDGWVIYKDDYQDELSQQLDNLSKENIKKQVDENYQDDLKRKENSYKSGGKVLASLAPQPLNITAITYNRTTAYQYADYYWNDSTFTPYYRIDPSGNNCANYVAQAINAGLTSASPTTVPVATAMGPNGTYPPGDANWSQRWYYKFNTYNSSYPLANSASYAWINTAGQYSFITTNNWTKGPFGSSTTLCGLRTGDVVQIKIGNTYDHEGMAVSFLGACTLSNTLIDAHTMPRYHYPLSNWSTYPMRFIHITGGYK